MSNIITAFHNVLSHQRLVDFVATCAALDINTVLLTKVGGAAAQTGVPEAFKYALKHNIRLIILPDLVDIKSIFNNSELYFFISKEYATEEFNFKEFFEAIKGGIKPILVFGGLEPGFNKKELELGKAVHINVNGNIPSVSLAAITLFMLKNYKDNLTK
ncbi:MAG: RecB-family nuclease [Thermoproteota archaeon]|jgi:RecB-family nuclease